MSVPANWHHDLHDLPASAGHAAPRRREAPITWMRPTPPMPRPAPPIRHRPRPRPALRLADALVNWGTDLAWILAGIMAGGLLVGLAGLTVGVS